MNRHCFFSSFMFDAVHKAFGLVAAEGGEGGLEPSSLISDHLVLSLTTTQGFCTSVGRAEGIVGGYWALPCSPTNVLSVPGSAVSRRANRTFPWPPASALTLTSKLLSIVPTRAVTVSIWLHTAAMFPVQPRAATTAATRKPINKQQAEEAKWGAY